MVHSRVTVFAAFEQFLAIQWIWIHAFPEVVMNASQILVGGTLKADGTLELDEKPTLPPGRVEVLISSQSSGNRAETWWEFLQRSRAELLAQGLTFRTKEDIDADQSRHRSQDESRRQAINRQQTRGE
jgi:hypothetical protein